MLYRYYKGFERQERWKVVSVEQEAYRLESEDVAFATVLSIDECPAPGESASETAKYFGPFYVDIDSDDLKKAIKATKKVVKILSNLGISPEVISIFASGKKGFHITVPMEVFCDPVPIERLPIVYKQMAIALDLFKIEEMDATVYSQGKGRMWRLAGKQRPDTQTYKVQILAEELETMSVVTYTDAIKQARPPLTLPNPVRVAQAEGLFKLSLGRAQHMTKPKGVFIDPNLLELLQGELPPCAKGLLAGENVKEGIGFNQVSLQFGKAVAAFAIDKAYPLIDEFAKNSKGESYKTAGMRKSHCRSAFNLAQRNSGYDWSCPSMVGILKDEPCLNCPIVFIRHQTPEDAEDMEDMEVPAVEKTPSKPAPREQFQVPPDPVKAQAPAPPDSDFNEEGLMTTDKGYGFMEGSGKFRPISNFTLKITQAFLEYIPNMECEVRVAVRADVIIGKRRVGSVFLEDGHWNSKSAFIGAFHGVANAGFYGKDDDVQKMRIVLLMSTEHVQQIRRVYSIGVHRQKVGKEWVFAYVEPGWSSDQFGNENLYKLSGDIQAAPSLKLVDEVQHGDPMIGALISNLLRVNQPNKVAQILGWTMACFLIEHIFTFTAQFPLLSLHGEPGSGKTSTAGVFAALHGIDYLRDASPVNLPSSTNFVLWNFISSSTTIPRLMEEYNKSKMPRTYDSYGEIFKQCWNHHAVSRGTISKSKHHGSTQIGASAVDVPLTGPVVLCSEQSLYVPAVVERTIQIRMTKKDKDNPNMKSAYKYVAERVEDMASFARSAYMHAIRLSPSTVRQWLNEGEDHVPEGLSERPKHAFQCVLLGLRFIVEICKDKGLEVHQEISEMREGFIEWLKTNREAITMSKQSSEVDSVVARWSDMAASQDNALMVKNVNYATNGDLLYIDMATAFPEYKRYTQLLREIVVVDKRSEFDGLIRGETYWISDNMRVDGMFKGRPALALSFSKMLAKGIDISGFDRDD